MSVTGRWRQQDLLLRALGVASVLIAMIALQHLAGSVHRVPRHEATFTEMGMAAVGFMGTSLGGALTLHGAHIHDKVEIAERWRIRPVPSPVLRQLGSDEALTHFDLRAAEQAWRAPQLPHRSLQR